MRRLLAIQPLLRSTSQQGGILAGSGDSEDLQGFGTVTASDDLFFSGPVGPHENAELETAESAAASNRVLVTLSPDEIPAGFQDLGWSRVCPGIYTVSLLLDQFEELAAVPQVKFIEKGRPMCPLLDTSLIETKANIVHSGNDQHPQFDGSGVVVGIIDMGFDYTLADFRDAQGFTRVEFLWDQFLTPAAGEKSPLGNAYGVEYSRADIDRALSATNPFSVVRHQPPAVSHGTHVAGIAAGNGLSADSEFPPSKYVGMAPGSSIIFVHPDSRDGNTFTDSTNVADAIGYILDKARGLGKPCVINLSLGQNGGSHDGESTVERVIDRLLEDPGRAFVVAAGNEQTYCGHTAGVMTKESTQIISWLFGGNPLFKERDTTLNELEIWYSSRDVFNVRLTDPSGYSTPWVEINNTYQERTPNGDLVFINSERFTALNGDAQIFISVGDENMISLTSGTWQVEINALTVQNGRYDAWIERDSRDARRGFADQSVFPSELFDGVMTLGTPATSRRAVAVANYDHRKQTVSAASSRGKTRDGRNKPEIAAPGTQIVSSCSGGGRGNPPQPMRIAMSGTSMSAPHVSGIIALMLEKNGTLTAEQIRKILIASADSSPTQSGFDIAWGYGRVNTAKALELTP